MKTNNNQKTPKDCLDITSSLHLPYSCKLGGRWKVNKLTCLFSSRLELKVDTYLKKHLEEQSIAIALTQGFYISPATHIMYAYCTWKELVRLEREQVVDNLCGNIKNVPLPWNWPLFTLISDCLLSLGGFLVVKAEEKQVTLWERSNIILLLYNWSLKED